MHTLKQKHLFSLSVTLIIILTNILLGWASFNAIKIIVPFLFVYNIVDSYLNWNDWMHPKNDHTMMYHHGGVLLMIIAFYFNYKQIGYYHNDIYKIAWWFLIMEISSIFYNLRFVFKDTKWSKQFDQLFGASFLVIRSIATIGFINVLIGNRFDLLMAPFIILFCVLNIYWGYLIVKKLIELMSKSKNKSKDKTKEKEKLSLKTITLTTTAVMFLILIYNRF